jgi:hypothetical protein
VFAGAIPVLAQLITVQFRPLDDELAGAPGQTADDGLQRLDIE